MRYLLCILAGLLALAIFLWSTWAVADVTDLFEDGATTGWTVDLDNCNWGDSTGSITESGGSMRLASNSTTEDDTCIHVVDVDELTGAFDIRTQITFDSNFQSDACDYLNYYADVSFGVTVDHSNLEVARNSTVEINLERCGGNWQIERVDTSAGGSQDMGGYTYRSINISTFWLRITRDGSGNFACSFAASKDAGGWTELASPSSPLVSTSPNMDIFYWMRGEDLNPQTTVQVAWVTDNSEEPNWPWEIITDRFDNGSVNAKWATGDMAAGGGTVSESGGALEINLPETGASYTAAVLQSEVALDADIVVKIRNLPTTISSSVLFALSEDYSDFGAGGPNDSVSVTVSAGLKVSRHDCDGGACETADYQDNLSGSDEMYLRIKGDGEGNFQTFAKAVASDPWEELTAPSATFSASSGGLDLILAGYQPASGGDTITIEEVRSVAEVGFPRILSQAYGRSPWAGNPWMGRAAWGQVQ